MAKVTNLRQARKQAARKAARADADANAAKFGQSKVERQLEKARAEKATREHEAHRREPD